jgi:hypothetical protein
LFSGAVVTLLGVVLIFALERRATKTRRSEPAMSPNRE